MLIHGFARGAVITPSDTVNFVEPCEAIYVGAVGDVTVVLPGNQGNLLFSAVPAGTTIPIKAKRVNATGTTATGLRAFWGQ